MNIPAIKSRLFRIRQMLRRELAHLAPTDADFIPRTRRRSKPKRGGRRAVRRKSTKPAKGVQRMIKQPPNQIGFTKLDNPPGKMLEHTIAALVLLGQASLDASIDRFLEFLAKIMMLVGVVLVAYGGIKIHRGESADGLMAIVGGFVVAAAIPIVRFLFSIV